MERVPGHDTRRLLSSVSRDKDTPANLVLEYEDGLYRTLGTGHEVKTEESRAVIRELISGLGGNVTAKEIAAESAKDEGSQMSVRTVTRLLSGMFEANQVNREGAGKSNNPYRWT
jgi:hypothetical protein